VPVRSSSRSASVDLPWSICAMMTKLRMCFWSNGLGREPNTVLRGIALLTLVSAAACQAPAPATPTPASAPPPPTAPAAKPTSAASIASPSAAPVGSPSPQPLAAPTPPAVGTSRVDILNAANAAFAKGDLATASGLYERVLNTPPAGEPATTTAAINDFAHFRDMVTLLAAGREDDARAQLDALQKSDANAAFARLANQLWDQYGMVGQLRGACVQLQPEITSQAGATLTALRGLGVNVDAQTLCAPPTS
jgi:hypothetical protein